MKGIGGNTGFTDRIPPSLPAEPPEHKSVDEDMHAATLAWQGDVFSRKAHTWDQLQLLRDNWEGPIVLKGIQHVNDARKAVEAGMDGIIVSNHGGRQLDGAIGSLEVLPNIVDAFGNDITVLFDSGVCTGVDVIKALCLGAKGVCIGRPWAYGLGIVGRWMRRMCCGEY